MTSKQWLLTPSWKLHQITAHQCTLHLGHHNKPPWQWGPHSEATIHEARLWKLPTRFGCDRHYEFQPCSLSLKEPCHQGTAREVNDSNEGNSCLYTAHTKLTYYIFTPWGPLTNCMILKHRYLTYVANHWSFPLRLIITFWPSFDFSSVSRLFVVVPLHCVVFPCHADLAEFIYKACSLSVSSFFIVLHPAIIGISRCKDLCLSIFHMQPAHLGLNSFINKNICGISQYQWHYRRLRWFWRMMVFYSVHGSNSVAFVDFALSPCSSV